MSSSDSSDSELLVQALPAPDLEPSEPPNLEKALTSPEEYIKWVRYEASTYSDVMHTAVNSEQTAVQECYNFSEPAEDISVSHELLLLSFEETVQVVTPEFLYLSPFKEYRAFKSVIPLEKNKERLSSKTSELFKNPPSLSWIAQRSRADLGTLLEMVASCCTKKNWNSTLRIWIFALMVALEPPLHPDFYHSLRAIAKRCRKLKKDYEDVSDKNSLDLQFFDLCPLLVARGFGQLDILK
ncbi:Gem-associated protein 2 [Paragonimus heterotremus]|uniref:Gem-associated protein 2 n=1 Tax=Paragonimus heterotremus TaxID=100268 RepID=A0A8J4T2T6_9TREM|nr:Gem-associated protein 2 [Paragonimus heterotremus]